MQQFSIFKKTTKFYWTKNRIIYSILFVCFSISIIKQKIFGVEPNGFDAIFLGSAIIVLFGSLFVKLLGFTKPDSLRGELDGFITFNRNEIIIDKNIINLSDIVKIEITNEDYYGKLKSSSKGDFNSSLSNGVDNKLTVELNSGLKETVNYELYNANDFQKIRKELINYYRNGKIDFENLANVLGEKSREEIEELKIETAK